MKTTLGEGLVNSLASVGVPLGVRNDFVVESYLIYHRQLRSFFQRTVSEVEAEDLLQELYIRLIRQMDRSPPDNCKGFLFSAATNMLRDRWRRRAVRKLDQMDSFDDLRCDFEDAAEQDPSLWSEQMEQMEQLDAALSQVSEKAAQAFVCHRVEGRSYMDIAEHMGVSVSMVEKYISSALAELRRSRL